MYMYLHRKADSGRVLRKLLEMPAVFRDLFAKGTRLFWQLPASHSSVALIHIFGPALYKKSSSGGHSICCVQLPGSVIPLTEFSSSSGDLNHTSFGCKPLNTDFVRIIHPSLPKLYNEFFFQCFGNRLTLGWGEMFQTMGCSCEVWTT